MKKKITISLDENILSKIDDNVSTGDGKNRSKVIENILKERYSDFADITCIIFAHDYKWDNRLYPFEVPKSLLEVRKRTIISTQLDTFSKSGIQNYIILIPNNTKELFEAEIIKNFPFLKVKLVEINDEVKTGDALKIALKQKEINNKLLISNGDIFYGNLNIEEYYNYHKDQKSDFSFCLKFVLNPEQLGNVKINGNKVIDFVEKPKASEMNLSNSGLYFTQKDFMNKNDFGEYLEHDFFPKLPELGKIIGYIYSGEWEHIQNDSSYERVNGWLI